MLHERTTTGFVWLFFLASLFGCSKDPRTQVTLRIEAEPGVVSQTRSLSVEVFGSPSDRSPVQTPNDRTFEQAIAVHGESSFPFRIALVPKDNQLGRRFWVVVRAQRSAIGETESSLVTSRVLSAFLARETRELVITLQDACRDVMCGDTQTCNRGVCEEVRPINLADAGFEDAQAADTGIGDAGGRDGASDVGTDASQCSIPCAEPREELGTCTFSTSCSLTGTQSVTTTVETCSNNACVPSTSTSTLACSRDESQLDPSCRTCVGTRPADEMSAWGECAYGDPICGQVGSRTATLTSYSCQGTSWIPSMQMLSDRTGCARTTSGISCGTDQIGEWSVCSFADGCSAQGEQRRTVTSPICSSNRCISNEEEEVQVCTRTLPTGCFDSGTPLVRPANATNWFGTDVSISADGNTLAVSTQGESISIYTRTSDVWSLQQSIDAPSSARGYGESIALSADGNVLAVGDREGGANYKGSVNLYVRTGDRWSPGTDIVRPGDAYYFGTRVALSSDGQVLAVSDMSAGSDRYGRVSIYTNNGTTWSRTDLPRPADTRSSFGRGLAMSADGTTIAIGSFYGTFVSVRNQGTWSTPIALGQFGYELSLSADGHILVAGRPQTDGTGDGIVTVFERNGSTWSSGTNVALPPMTFFFGQRVYLSGDGNSLAVSQLRNGGGGAVTVFQRAGNGWASGIDLAPRTFDFGTSLSLSNNGNTAVVSGASTNGLSGSVTVFHR